jgi:hypothetical protein
MKEKDKRRTKYVVVILRKVGYVRSSENREYLYD